MKYVPKLDLDPGRSLRAKLQQYRSAVLAYHQQCASAAVWRNLQYEVMCCYIDAQRASIDTHAAVLSRLRYDEEAPCSRYRADSLVLLSELRALHEVLRAIERRLAS